MPDSAAIICTRNRPEALRQTLASVAEQDLPSPPNVLVVDASDSRSLSANQKAVDDFSPLVEHIEYDGTPSAARQRNMGLCHLPDATDVVFFLDDDITLRPGCLRHLASALYSSPFPGGVGALEVPNKDQSASSVPSRSPFWKYLFLLDHPRPGRVLPSGRISSYSSPFRIYDDEPFSTEWLSTCCCAYKTSVLDEIQFDDSLWGALLEDLDLSYRVSKSSLLITVPESKFVHHRSPRNRRSVYQYAHDRLVQRYWFVDKNVDSPFAKPAFWWGTLGQLIASLLSPKENEKWEALRGRLNGIREILFQSHPLLRSETDSPTASI
jgi:GT2 family glycosyltransferase